MILKFDLFHEPPGGGGNSHIRAIRVCAFCLSDSGTGYRIQPFDSETGSIFFPESLSNTIKFSYETPLLSSLYLLATDEVK